MDNELDALLDQLKNDQGMSTIVSQTSTVQTTVNDDSVNEFILKNTGKLIETGLTTIDTLTQGVLNSDDPEQLQAYSDLIKSVVGAIDTLNKVNIQNKKTKAAKELKEMDITHTKGLPAASHNTNILVATREDVIKAFLDKNKELKTIDTTIKEDKEEDIDDGPPEK